MTTTIPEVAAAELITAGQTQLLVIDCPRCSCTHRHLAAGERRAPCGARYNLIDRNPTERTS
ncbi:hypothetical protein [Streptomyces sp. NBC_00271]|uniref:hypothetical protein n=1 Tax=Streptomyces sp. NBC_00271 TaxID=2975697 RepID=UPI002E2BD586|nr:hypothetical protein [Streptomyces sp. NBC_00271]